ncbi:hypothetical protein LTR56_027804 [Elasticomyces elasticus]|nr:hypothetical protein LTR56_027804 [Elasticomyces elasticus]
MGKFSTRAERVKKSVKIVIVGAGHVGAATGFALMLKNLADEIVLIDVDESRAEGEVLDLSIASLNGTHPDVYAGSYEDCQDASIVIVTAGQAPAQGQTDQDLLAHNLKVIKDVAPKLGRLAPRALVIVATHPSEVLTYVAARLSGLPDHRVIGYGTSMDTARFKYELAKHYGVDSRDVNAAVVGQHGITEMPLWSSITIDGLPIRSYCNQVGMEVEDDEVYACFLRARKANFNIIDHKGHPSFGMAAGIAAIVEAILRDEHTLVAVAAIGTYFGIKDVALSVPTRLSRAGAIPMPGWSDDWAEEDAIRDTAEEIRRQIASLNIAVPEVVKAHKTSNGSETLKAKVAPMNGFSGNSLRAGLQHGVDAREMLIVTIDFVLSSAVVSRTCFVTDALRMLSVCDRVMIVHHTIRGAAYVRLVTARKLQDNSGLRSTSEWHSKWRGYCAHASWMQMVFGILCREVAKLHSWHSLGFLALSNHRHATITVTQRAGSDMG